MGMRSAIKKHIPINANSAEIGEYLKEIMEVVSNSVGLPEHESAMHFMFGRFLFSKGELDRAYNEFQHSSTLCIDYGLAEFSEISYWVGRIAVAKNDLKRAKMCYEGALKVCKDDPLFISREEIEKEMEGLVMNNPI